jgi:hypothetical protein
MSHAAAPEPVELDDSDEPAGPGFRANCLTLCTPIKKKYVLWVRLLLFLAQTFPVFQGMAQFRTIYFTRWSVLSRIPHNGPPQLPEELKRPILLWETNYNGDIHQYVEAFSVVIPGQINRTWSTSYGFPGASPITPLVDYIDSVRYPVLFYHSAYPEASVRMIQSAQRIAALHGELRAVAETGDDAAFAAAYERFLERSQGDL